MENGKSKIQMVEKHVKLKIIDYLLWFKCALYRCRMHQKGICHFWAWTWTLKVNATSLWTHELWNVDMKKFKQKKTKKKHYFWGKDNNNNDGTLCPSTWPSKDRRRYIEIDESHSYDFKHCEMSMSKRKCVNVRGWQKHAPWRGGVGG